MSRTSERRSRTIPRPRAMVLWAAILNLAAAGPSTATEARPQLIRAAAGGDPATAAVLLGGINDTWRSLREWVPLHRDAGRQVFGYPYDQKRSDLQTSARGLAEQLRALRARGVRRLYLTAYSMGGWVAKAALDQMGADGSLAEFDSVELTALGTPWGGFHRANIAWRLRRVPTPGLARALSRVIGKPMAFEVGSVTPFVRARRAALPASVTFRVYEGGADEIATPHTAQERANYEAVVGLAAERVRVPRARHADMLAPRLSVVALELTIGG